MRFDLASLWLVGLTLAAGVTGCREFFQAFTPFPGGAPGPIPGATVLVKVRNESGLMASVEAVYFVESNLVRRTQRLLADAGNFASAEMLLTRTTRVAVSASVADEAVVPPNAQVHPGDFLGEREFLMGRDFQDGGIVEFVIPPPGGQPLIIDCNANNVRDADDIASGTSADCDANTIPDECEADTDGDGRVDACDGCPTDPIKTTPGTCGCGVVETDTDGDGVPDCADLCPGGDDHEDCNGNGVPDACEIPPLGGGTEDCNANGVPDECDIASGASEDCQPNGVPDECDLAAGQGVRLNPLGDGPNLVFPLDGTYTLAMQPNDDGSTTEIPLGFTFNLYGSAYTSVFINNNGNISFGSPYSTYTSTGFPVSGFPMVAPFWADVDTRPEVFGGPSLGAVWYKIENNTLVVIWDQVGYYSHHGDKRNTFELAISDGLNPVMGLGNNVCFSYGGMEWTTGDASGGAGGFGGVPATVGVNRGNGVDFILIGRFDHAGTDYDGPGGVADGVDFLDGRRFFFNASTTNISPIPNNLPPGNLVTLMPTLGDVLDLQIQFLSPELGQTTSVTFSDPNGAVAAGLSVTTTIGNVATVDLNWTPACGDAGIYLLHFTATDNNAPPGVTSVTLTIDVPCGSQDCNGNRVPDECEVDSDGDGVIDGCDICPDGDDQRDCDDDGTPDACENEPDCNENGVPDSCDIADGASQDSNGNGIPDECEPSCPDADEDGVCDEDDNCPDHPNPGQEDCDNDGTGDACTIANCTTQPACDDCNDNGVPDGCDIANGTSQDANENGVPDECEFLPADCNNNGIADDQDITDCSGDPACADCNGNNVLDLCESPFPECASLNTVTGAPPLTAVLPSEGDPGTLNFNTIAAEPPLKMVLPSEGDPGTLALNTITSDPPLLVVLPSEGDPGTLTLNTIQADPPVTVVLIDEGATGGFGLNTVLANPPVTIVLPSEGGPGALSLNTILAVPPLCMCIEGSPDMCACVPK